MATPALGRAGAPGGSTLPLPLPDFPRYTTQHFGDQYGLSVVSANALVQDPQGFLWIGTQTGLYRYDGSRVLPMVQAERIVGHYIDDLLVAPDGTLWVKGSHGVAHLKDGYFERVPLPSNAIGIRRSGQTIAVDHEGDAFITLDKGILCVPAHNPSRFKLITRAEGLPGTPGAVVLGPGDSVWFTAGRRLGHFRQGSAGFAVDAAIMLPNEMGTGLIFDRTHTLWLRTQSHVDQIDLAHHRLIQDDRGVAPANPDVGGLTLDHAGNVLVPSVAGLFWRDHGHWRAITAQQGLTGNDVQAALEDREGVIWVAGSGTGLDRVVGIREWSTWTTDEGLPDNSIWSTVRDREGRLWVATAHGIAIWDPSSREWRQPRKETGLASHEIRQLVVAGDGAIWALSPLDGIVRINPRTLRAQSSSSFGGQKYLFEAVAPDGSIWATTPDQLVRFDPYAPSPLPSSLPVPDRVRGEMWDLTFAPDGALWVSGRARVMRFDSTGWSVYTQTDGIVGKSVTSLVALAGNDVWIGYDDVVEVTHLRVDDRGTARAEQHEWDYAVVGRDAQHRVWLSGTNGLTIIAPDGSTKTLSHADGLAWDDISPTGVRQESDGSYIIATSRGLSRLAPQGDLTAGAPPRVVLTSVTLGGHERLGIHWPDVPRDESTLSVYFTPLTLSVPEEIVCRYQLQGFDREYTVTLIREAHYTALPPGRYAFSLQCQRESSGWTPQPATFAFQVLPAFWETWWARSIAIALLAMFVWGLVLVRTRSLDASRRELEQAVEERNAELVDKNRELREMSLTDPLTHTRNRRYLQETIESEVAQVLRARAGAFSVERAEHPGELVFAMVDIDGFKAVNDAHGHVVGDRMLQRFAERLATLMRASDVLIRWGGEEFLMICRATDRSGGQALGKRIVDEITAQPFDLGNGIVLNKTCSVGWAPFPWTSSGVDTLTVENVIELADHALYLAKDGGRNQSVGILPSSTAMRSPHRLRMDILRTYPPELVEIVRVMGSETARASGYQFSSSGRYL